MSMGVGGARVVLTVFDKFGVTVTAHKDEEALCKELLNQRDTFRFIEKHLEEARAGWVKEAAEDAALEERQKYWPAWRDQLKKEYKERGGKAADIWPGDYKDHFDDGMTVVQVLDEVFKEEAENAS